MPSTVGAHHIAGLVLPGPVAQQQKASLAAATSQRIALAYTLTRVHVYSSYGICESFIVALLHDSATSSREVHDIS